MKDSTMEKKKGFRYERAKEPLRFLFRVFPSITKIKKGSWSPFQLTDPLTKERIQNKEIPVMKQVAGFTKGHVFDITQTNAEEKD